MGNMNYTEHHQSQHLYRLTQAILKHILTEFIVRVHLAERWDNSERVPRTISVKLFDSEKAFENCTDMRHVKNPGSPISYWQFSGAYAGPYYWKTHSIINSEA